MELQGLKQPLHFIKDVCNAQRASSQVKNLLSTFHNNLITSLDNRGQFWIAKTHQGGITYFCSERKAFVYLNINRDFLSMKFFSGTGKISKMQKGTWNRSGEDCGSQNYRIVDTSSLQRAVGFALEAYQLAKNWDESQRWGLWGEPLLKNLK